MEDEHEEQVQLDDLMNYTSYINDYNIVRLPDTLIGNKLKEHKRVKNVFGSKKYLGQNEDEKAIMDDVEALLDIQSGLNENESSQNHLDSVFNMFENILNYPYDDVHRILDLSNYRENKILTSTQFHKLIVDVDFEPGPSEDIMVYPYDKDIGQVLFALDVLISKISSVNVESYMGFPFFQKYSEHLGVDLTIESAGSHEALNLKHEDAAEIFDQTGCQKLEDYIIELGENSEEFQRVLLDILGHTPSTHQFLTICREMWVECNVLRQTAVFLRQCFADPISRAVLSNSIDRNSKIARSIVNANIEQVNGIKMGTNGTVGSIEDMVYLFVERETYKFQKLSDGVKKIDRELNKGFGGNKDQVTYFWDNIKNLMVERLSRKQLQKRDNISDQKLKEWINCWEPELTIHDLPEYSKNRIQNEEVLNEIERSHNNINSSRAGNLFYNTDFFKKDSSKKQIIDAARDAVWKPGVWLHQKQLVDDFIFYTILTDLCTELGCTMSFNLKQCFSNFTIYNMPVLLYENDMKKETYINLSRKRRTWEQPLDLKLTSDLIHPQSGSSFEHLYKNSFDKILHPTAINGHFDQFKLFLEWGAEVNTKDFQGWTPLHCAAYSGNIEILKFLIGNPSTELESEDDERRTPLIIAIESGNVLGNDNATSILLEAGAELDPDIWDKLCLLAAEHDLMVYPRLAHKHGYLNIKYRNELTFSLYKVIKCDAINVARFIVKNMDPMIIKKYYRKLNKDSKFWLSGYLLLYRSVP